MIFKDCVSQGVTVCTIVCILISSWMILECVVCMWVSRNIRAQIICTFARLKLQRVESNFQHFLQESHFWKWWM